jgi:kumamolisin
VLGALQRATPVAANPGAESEPLTLTVTLKRVDEAGFDRYLHDVYDPQSPNYRHFLTQSQIATRFGPTSSAYNSVLAYLQRNGFELVAGSTNRLTVTVRGTRAQTERAFAVHIRDYRGADRTFHANDHDPALPVGIARLVQAVSGLSDFATVQHGEIREAIGNLFKPFYVHCIDDCLGTITCAGSPPKTRAELIASNVCGKPPSNAAAAAAAQDPQTRKDPPPTNWLNVNGTGQKIGLLEFDTFNLSDISNYLALWGYPSSLINQVNQVPVNGGVALGAWESEVLLDIVAALATAPGASIAVYSGPFTGIGAGFQTMFNRMISDGMNIISNSWYYCENHTTLADVQSIDSILATAAASGITIFNATGDSGSTCDGSPNTVAVPASSPNATAVGGTTLRVGPAGTYVGETWWDGSQNTPPSGQGGFGVSGFFSRPAYQNNFTASPMRSVPDIVINGDAAQGMILCQADAGGCPADGIFGGTSGGAPMWAGFAALLNQAQGQNLGNLNALLYPLAGTNAFHSAASMGSDFAHVGLGSPNLNVLHLLLSGQAAGPVNGDVSQLDVDCPLQTQPSCAFVAADGLSKVQIVPILRDANGNLVSGKTVALMPTLGTHAVITPASGVSDIANGAVVFEVTNTTIEDVTLTAVDVTDNVALTNTYTVSFVSRPATAASISASPSVVPADGSSKATITVTLKDADGNGTSGKLVTIAQGNGHSIVTGPDPALTDANGQIQFTATDNVGETVTYTAVDVTDGNLPVPGSTSVTYTGAGSSCVTSPPTAAPGFTLTPFANGFAAQNFFYSNVNWSGCPGASNPAFDKAGNVFVSDFFNGNLYEFGLSGGAVSNADTLAAIGQALEQPAFGIDGSLYVARGATGSGFNSGAVLRVDPDTGAVLQTVVSGLTCPSPLAVDPLSGDLFFTDNCFGAGSDNPSLWRIENPASANPTLVVYATLPSTPNGAIAFAPNGTMYVVNNYNAAKNVIQVAGTNTPSPPAMTTLAGITSDFWVTMGEVQPNGAAKSLLVDNSNALKLVDITTNPPTTIVLANGSLGSGTIGPDGCLYTEASDTVFKLAPSAGPCSFTPTNPAPALDLSPASVSPNPVQGTSTIFTATLRNVGQPQGSPITFVVGGANSLIKMVRADSNGKATFSYSGVFAGMDKVTATATLDPDSPMSNAAQVTWTPGKHTTFLSLNSSPTGGTVGQAVTVTASLTDVSSDPAAAIANANITFTLGKSACPAVTDAKGLASCMVIPGAAGLLSLNAAFPGNANYVNSSASAGFNVLGPIAPPQNKCPMQVGFWTNHAGAWPVHSLTLGSQSYTQAELLTILNTPVGSGGGADASLMLATELIATKLDIANGSDATPVSATIADADQLLSQFAGKLPYHVKPSSPAGQEMVHDNARLKQYEHGKLTPHCVGAGRHH